MGKKIIHLKHNSVYLFFNFLIRDYNSTLRALQKQVKESKTLLLSDIIILNVQVVFQTSSLTEGQTLNGSVLNGSFRR